MEFNLTENKASELKDYCQRKQITEIFAFGSVLTPAFNETSDIDLLISFDTLDSMSLFKFIEIEEDLSNLLGRKVDLHTKNSIEQSPNTFLRKSILESAVKILYA